VASVLARAGHHQIIRKTIKKETWLIGWIGSVAFAVCGIPPAWECYKNKSAKGINPTFIGLWLLGEVCYVISILMKFGWVNWMMFNYIANLLSIGVIIFYLLKDNKLTAVP
jgi:uncharacterized protein with PQ loop repeat